MKATVFWLALKFGHSSLLDLIFTCGVVFAMYNKY